MKKLTLFALLFLASFLFFSCEKEKSGLIDPKLTGPFITSASLRAPALNLDTTTGSAVTHLPKGQYEITDPFTVHVTDVNGIQNITQVTYRVYLPGVTDYVTSGTLNRGITDSAGVFYSGQVSFIIGRNDVGIYKVEAVASDQFNLSSNAEETSLLVSRRNSIPQVTSADVPDTVTLAKRATVLITMTATASDSDGQGDIARVYFYSLDGPDSTFKFVLLDDGNANSLSGDVLAGDGIYTITVKLIDKPPPAAPVRKSYRFVFHAEDKAGAVSPPLTKTMVVN
ncbi:MAG: hypothetical protein ABSF91_02845 [Bacteroidota bacterium]|jgi:hypothetical protein